MNDYIIVVLDLVGYGFYYAADYSLTDVRKRFKKLSGKYPSSKAVIRLIVGSEDYTVSEFGEFAVPKGTQVIKLQN